MADWTDNPFAQAPAAEESPFSDPSITSAQDTAIPEYNPFENPGDAGAGAEAFAAKKEKQKKQEKKKPEAAASAPLKVAQDVPSWAQPEPAAETSQPRATTAEEQQRQAEYARNQEIAADPRLSDPNYRPVNWPPFPAGCPKPFKPCYHHNFKRDIPAYGYNTIKQVYYLWLFFFITLLWNFICNAAMVQYDFAPPGMSTGAMADQWGPALAYILVCAPCSYCCWFQSLYQGMRKDSSLRYGWFFLTFFAQLGFSIAGVVGATASGFAGFIFAGSTGGVYEALGMSCALMWLICAILNFYLLSKVLKIYRSSGQSLDRAQQEAASGAVKGAVASGAADAAAQQLWK